MRIAAAALAALILFPSAADASCNWREPRRTFPTSQVWECRAMRWSDGDTLTARCAGLSQPVRVRLRGIDTPERGERRYREAGRELQRRTEGRTLEIRPRHRSWDRVVADVLVDGVNVGRAMDAAGWSKEACPRR